MKFVLLACLLAAALPSVLGHAAIVTPVPFNANPSKSYQCGGASSGPVTRLVAGATVGLTWKIVAGDGVGAIRMVVDPYGPTLNLPTANAQAVTGSNVLVTSLTGPTPTAVISYDFTFVVPTGLKCNFTMGGYTTACVAQISSTSDWVGCFAYSTVDAPSTGTGSNSTAAALNGVCTTPTLALLAGSGSTAHTAACGMIVGLGYKVFVPTGETLGSMDLNVRNTLTQNLPNANVFNNHQDATAVTPCSTAYTNYMCGAAFVLCNSAGTALATPTALQQPCAKNCEIFKCLCDITLPGDVANPHYLVYPCTTNADIAFSNTDHDVTVSLTAGCPKDSRFYTNASTVCVPRTVGGSSGSFGVRVNPASVVVAIAAFFAAIAVYMH